MLCLQQSTAPSVPGPVALDEQAHWYAAYTRANHEKRVAEQLGHRCVETFLPVYEEVHQWKDRRKRVSLPLFSGYVFVRTELRMRSAIQQVPGLVYLVGFGGAPTPLPDREIESLRFALNTGSRAEPVRHALEGKRARIKRGPFTGFEGVVVRQRKSLRLILSIDLIRRAVLIDLDDDSITIETSRTSDAPMFGQNGKA